MTNVTQTNRLQQILLIVLLVQIGLGVWIFWPRPAASQASDPLLGEISADDITALTISDSDNAITLTKEDGEWVLADAGDYPANSETVTSLLEDFEAVVTNRLVTQTEASHKRLQVAPDEFNRHIEITLTDGSTRDLYIGSTAGAGATHVRLDDEPEVYLTGEVSPWDINTQAAGWIDTLYFTVPQTATTKLTLENESGTLEFVREDDAWTLSDLAEDETFNESAFTSLLGQVTSVRMTEPVGQEEQASFGLDEPLATVTLETDDGVRTLLVGAQDPEDNSYIIKASDSPYYVRIAEFTGSNLIDKTREDFLQTEEQEETPDIEIEPVERE